MPVIFDIVFSSRYHNYYFLSFASPSQAASFRRVPSSSSGGVTSARTRGWASHTMTWFTWSLRPRWSEPAEQPRLAECSTARVRIRAKSMALPPWGSHMRDPPPPVSSVPPTTTTITTTTSNLHWQTSRLSHPPPKCPACKLGLLHHCEWESCVDGKISSLLPFPASYKKQIFHQKQVCACVDEGLSWINGISEDITLHVSFNWFLCNILKSLSAFVALLRTERTGVGHHS